MMSTEKKKELELDSGTSGWLKFMFAQTMMPLWLLVIVVGQSASIYSLVYKCDIAVLGGLLVLVALLDIVMNPIAGYLQDQEFLDSKGFPVKTWGRRASWFVTHFPLTLLVLAAILLPPQSPSSDPTAVTYLWFFFVSIVAKWVHTVNTVAINAAGDEIYPSQAERTQLFGYRVAIIVIAVLVAVVCTQSIIGDADNSPDRCCAAEFEGNLPKTCIVSTSINSTNTTYIIDINLKSDVSTSVVMVIVLTVLSFLGLLGVKPLMFAKQPVKEGARDRKQGLFKGLHEFLYWKPFVCLFCAEFFDKVAGQTLTAIAPFFMTYFLWLDRDEFAQVLILLTVIGMFMQVLSVALCAWYFGTPSKSSKTISINPRWYAVFGVLSCTVLQPLLIELADGGYEDDGVTRKKGSVGLILLSFIFSRFAISPLRTFTNAARGWLVDADVQRTGGERREGQIGSLLLISTNIAGVVTMLILASLGPFGIDTSKCWGEAQDKGGVAYLKGVMQWGNQVLLWASAFCVWLFPIHGDKLKELENRQREYYVKHPDGARNNKVAPSSTTDTTGDSS